MFLSFVNLVKLYHVVFALPFVLATVFLLEKGFPSTKVFILIILAVVFCRNAAMAFNRWVDCNIDAENLRTKNRPLPKGDLSVRQVQIFIVINALAFLIVCYLLNTSTFLFSFFVLGIVFSYSFFKRLSSFSQVFLGFALGLSPVATSLAMIENINILSVTIGFALFLWVMGFDVIYSLLDYEFDLQHDLHSIPILLGYQKSIWFARCCHLVMLLVLLLIGFLSPFLQSLYFYFILLGILPMLIYLHFGSENKSLDSLNDRFFLGNALVSVLFLLAVILSVF